MDLSLKAAGARTYEPAALLPGATFGNAMLALRFYQYTGNKKFLNAVPDAIRWLEETRLPEDKTQDGRYTHPTFIEPGTNKPIYVHRKGSNVKYGYYYHDDNDENLLVHYNGKGRIPVDRLKEEYERLAGMTVEEATKDSPLTTGQFKGEGLPQNHYELTRSWSRGETDEQKVKEIIRTLDSKNRWLVKHAMISNPYAGDGQRQDTTDAYATTFVGDETDTSPFRDTSDQEYISTGAYIRNMYALIQFIRSGNERVGSKNQNN